MDRQGGTLFGKESFERFNRLDSDLRQIKERWDNRLSGKETSAFEAYINGDIEIVAYGKMAVGSDYVNWAVRIPSASCIPDGVIAGENSVNSSNLCNPYTGNEVIVLVGVAEFVDAPQVEVSVPARLYLFKDKVCDVGSGLLYRTVGLGSFKVFPFFREREVELAARDFGFNQNGLLNGVVEGFPEIVECISDNRAKKFLDWLFGPVGQIKVIRLSKQRMFPHMFNSDSIKIWGEGGRLSNQFIDVAFGPFDL